MNSFGTYAFVLATEFSFCVVLLFAALEDAYDSAIGANKIAWSRSLHFKYVVLSSTARAGIVVSGLSDQRKEKKIVKVRCINYKYEVEYV
jgi:hypothetical protein